MTIARNADGSFLGRYELNDRTMTITGQVTDNKAKVSAIEVRQGGRTTKYGSIEELPADLRPQAQRIVRGVESPAPQKD